MENKIVPGGGGKQRKKRGQVIAVVWLKDDRTPVVNVKEMLRPKTF